MSELEAMKDWSCPHCGAPDGIGVNVQLAGWEYWNLWGGDDDGAELGDDIKAVRTFPASGKCLRCGKTVNTPMGRFQR